MTFLYTSYQSIWHNNDIIKFSRNLVAKILGQKDYYMLLNLYFWIYLLIDLGVILASFSIAASHRRVFPKIFVADWLKPMVRRRWPLGRLENIHKVIKLQTILIKYSRYKLSQQIVIFLTQSSSKLNTPMFITNCSKINESFLISGQIRHLINSLNRSLLNLTNFRKSGQERQYKNLAYIRKTTTNTVHVLVLDSMKSLFKGSVIMTWLWPNCHLDNLDWSPIQKFGIKILDLNFEFGVRISNYTTSTPIITALME